MRKDIGILIYIHKIYIIYNVIIRLKQFYEININDIKVSRIICISIIKIRLVSNTLVFILARIFREPRALIRLLRLSRMTRWQEPSLAGSEWSIGRVRRTFRISVICGLNYPVNNTACSGLCSAPRGAARAGWWEDYAMGGGDGERKDGRGDWVHAGVGRAPAFVKPQHEPRL